MVEIVNKQFFGFYTAENKISRFSSRNCNNHNWFPQFDSTMQRPLTTVMLTIKVQWYMVFSLEIWMGLLFTLHLYQTMQSIYESYSTCQLYRCSIENIDKLEREDFVLSLQSAVSLLWQIVTIERGSWIKQMLNASKCVFKIRLQWITFQMSLFTPKTMVDNIPM